MRGFQYAWPPLAYSVESDEEAGRLYALVSTYYTLATGVVVCGVALLGRWMVRLLAEQRYFDAYKALPWLALGWALYGLYLVFVAISGRARVTSRNLPAAAAGLRGQHRAAAAPRPRLRGRARNRGRRDRALRRLRGDAHGHVRADPASCSPSASNGAGSPSSCTILAVVAVSGELLLPSHGHRAAC